MKIKYLIEALKDMDPEAEAAYRVYDAEDIRDMAEWGCIQLTEEQIENAVMELDDRMVSVGDMAWDIITEMGTAQ